MTKEAQVLFLDDDESILDSLWRLFIKEPYAIATASGVDQARTILAREKIKVVVSDQRMPDIQGVKFLEEVKRSYPDAVRILFTGYTDFSAAEEAINEGEVYRFISKPWKTAELLATIRQAIEYHDLMVDKRARSVELETAYRRLEEVYEKQKDFTSTVSHELRTPLASIKTAIDLVIKKVVGEINGEQAEVLGRAKRNVDRLKRLIDDVLDLTKMEAGKLQMNFGTNDIHQTIREVVDAFRDVAQERALTIGTELDANVPEIVFDRDRMVQVLNNLLGNAIKFTKQGGIMVRTRDQSQRNHIVVSIEDTGKGIAPFDLSGLFQKFHQIDCVERNEEGGTGLGLAICKEIISRHGGKIWIESAPGQGTTVYFILPVTERRMVL